MSDTSNANVAVTETDRTQTRGVTNGTTMPSNQQPKPSPSNDTEVNGKKDAQDAKDGGGGGKDHKSIKHRVKSFKSGPPGGFDRTPLPDAPPGYTVRFTFESAANLPPSDLNTYSSDPYLLATLKTSTPKRHKEEPDLSHRTRTVQKTTEPQWHEQWVVANLPPDGFTLKCRLYDQDAPDMDDRLGNVTIKVDSLSESWAGTPPPGKEYKAKKRVISKRAYAIKSLSKIFHSNVHMTPRLTVSMEVLGKSDPPHAQMYTVGPTTWIKHFSPLIGRIAGTKVDADEEDDKRAKSAHELTSKNRKTQKYDFQANQVQLAGPVPPKLYHRFVEFKPIIGSMFNSAGLRGKILHTALHKQHNRVYNFSSSTEYGGFDPCSREAALQFLRLVHFDSGGRVFTYVLTLDGLFRFTETGPEFGIDMLSKHTMHSDVQTYIACSGEFFVRRLEHPDSTDEPEPHERTHPADHVDGGPPKAAPPTNPAYYQLVIDNDSGTYRPDKSILPLLKQFLERNLPGLGIIAMHWEEEELKKLKNQQRSVKKREGRMVKMVMNGSQSSISSAESDLDDRRPNGKSKTEAALAAVEDPHKLKGIVKDMLPDGMGHHDASDSKGGPS